MTEERMVTCEPLEYSFRLAISDPPVCFCKKQAHCNHNPVHGFTLECGNYCDITKEGPLALVRAGFSVESGYVCGFHVHEKSWSQIRQALLQGRGLLFPTRPPCPWFNFTYCATFRVNNDFSKDIYLDLPKCFCKTHATYIEIKHKYGEDRSAYFFTCGNTKIKEGKKCDWIIEADKALFKKGEGRYPCPRRMLSRYPPMRHPYPAAENAHHVDQLKDTLANTNIADSHLSYNTLGINKIHERQTLSISTSTTESYSTTMSQTGKLEQNVKLTKRVCLIEEEIRQTKSEEFYLVDVNKLTELRTYKLKAPLQSLLSPPGADRNVVAIGRKELQEYVYDI